MSNKMLAAVYHGPNDLRVEEYPVPDIDSGEVLLRVISTGICGTDLRILHGGHRKYPPGTVRIPGHEVVGEIVQVGDEVSGLDISQHVVVAPNVGCGRCKQCVSGNTNLCALFNAPGITFDGSFAQYMRIPAAAILQGNLIPIDKSKDPAVATLIEPLACVLRGQGELRIQPAETILVIGAGPIGLMHIMLAKMRGAGKVVVSELIPERLTLAKELGADCTVNPGEENLIAIVAEETHGAGFDVVIVATPVSEAQEISLELAAIGGRINFFGGLPKDRSTIKFNSNLVHYKELLVTGTTGSCTNDCLRAVEIFNSSRIELSKLIGARFSLTDALEAFKAAEEGSALKVVMLP